MGRGSAARTRRAARLPASAQYTIASLPPALLCRVLSFVPTESRLRCFEVCRAWRAALAPAALWTRLDLCGIFPGRIAWKVNGLLRCAAGRSGNALASLCMDLKSGNWLTEEVLLEVLAANAGTLRELHSVSDPHSSLDVPLLEAILRAVPQLHTFHANSLLSEDYDATRRMVCNEAPFGPLRIKVLNLGLPEAGPAAFAALMAVLPRHASLEKVLLIKMPLDESLDAFVDAALALKLSSVAFGFCTFTAVAVPALARLLGGGALTSLRIVRNLEFGVHAAAALAPALRASTTLTSLTLRCVAMFRDRAHEGVQLIAALTGHVSLRELNITDNSIGEGVARAVGYALGMLLAVDAPALTELDVSGCQEGGDDIMRPMLEALAVNTHLRVLSCLYRGDGPGTMVSTELAVSVLLPSLRANTGLRELDLGFLSCFPGTALYEARQLVAERPNGC